MLTKDKIIATAQNKGKIKTADIVREFDVSRQYASGLISELVKNHKLIRVGTTRQAFYVSPEYAQAHREIFPNKILKTFTNDGVEEYKILEEVNRDFALLGDLPENIKNIFDYAFSEMLNNAIEHSQSPKIEVGVSIERGILTFFVNDFGVGVFRNIKQKKGLASELEAVQELLKGKTTTMPRSHSGEGIFFTSRSGDEFILNSFGNQLIVNNKIDDIFFQQIKNSKKGTLVTFKISTSDQRHLSEVFKNYANLDDEDGRGFDQTEIRIKLYLMGGVHISRSQARRVLSGLEKFKTIIFDFKDVPMVGQAFADEIFRVWHQHHPKIELKYANANEAVEFMIKRVEVGG